MTTMTFTLQGRDRLSSVMDRAGKSAGRLSLGLAAAGSAIPAAAALAPFIAGTTAAAGAVAAFGVAIVPQIISLAKASEAQKKYEDAVAESGRGSAEAAKANIAYQRELAKLPPATRESAAALSVLKQETREWSDALADDTMPVFTQGLRVAGAGVKSLTPLVQGSSRELGRFMTIIGGAMATPGVDRAMTKFGQFAELSLRKANDALVNFMRTADGSVGSGLEKFLDYARAQGPIVGETLDNLAAAAVNLLMATADVGVGVLQLANAFGMVVASLPPGFLTVLMQAAIAIKAITIAIAAVKLAAGGMLIVRTQIAAAGTAALGSATAMGSLRLAFMAMSLAARTAMAATGIGLLIIGLWKLSEVGKSTPPNVEKLTTSLAKLGQSGKLTGEGLRVLGKDFEKLQDAAQTLAEPSNTQKIEKFFDVFGSGGGPEAKEAAKVIKGTSEALADMVAGGKADLAAAAIKRMTKNMDATQLKEFNAGLGPYNDAIANAKLESELAADAQGLFGAQAQKTQEKLAAQKASADGLRQSIVALNDVNRAASGAMNAFEASIDSGMKVAKENAGGLKGAFDKVTGTLDLNSEKARNNEAALRELAGATDAAGAAARENGSSWESVQATYERGRAKFIELARAMGLTKTEAGLLADKMLKIPDKEVFFKGRIEDLDGKIKTAQRKVDELKQKSPAQLRANGGQLAKEKAEAQRRLDALKQKRAAEIRARDATAAGVNSAKNRIASVKGKTVTITSIFKSVYYTAKDPKTLAAAHGRASGGLIRGPGTSTSDSIATWLSNNEYVIKAASVSKYGVGLMDAINEGRLAAPAQASRAPYPVARASASAGGAPVVMNITVNGAMDPVAVGRQLQKVLLNLKRTHGVNVVLGVG